MPTPFSHDPDYVQGQIDALRALILGLAQMTTKREFREQSLERLEAVRTALLAEPVSESRLRAIDEFEQWVLAVTA